MSNAAEASPITGGDVLAAEGHAAALESLGRRLAGWIAPLVLLYVLIVRPLVFGDPLPSLSDDVLGWTVVADPYPSSPLKQVPYPIFFGLSILAMALTASYRRIPWLHPLLLSLMAFVAFAFASVTWSIVPSISFLRATLLCATTYSLVLSIYSAESYGPMMRRLFWILALTTLFNAVAIIVRPATLLGHSGIYDHKNVLGWVAAFILYFGCYRLISGTVTERFAAVAMVALAPVFLILSESKTSLGLAGLAPVMATGLWIGARYLRLSPALLFASFVIVAFFTFFLGQSAGLWDLFSVNTAIFGNPTLTGRTEIWHFVVGLISDRPLFGYGYEGVFSTGPDGIVARNGIGFVRIMPTSHNGYLDITVQLGIAGVALAVLYLLLAMNTVGRLVDINPPLAWLGLTLFVFVMMHNCLESDVLISSNPLSMTLITMCLIALRICNEHTFSPYGSAINHRSQDTS